MEIFLSNDSLILENSAALIQIKHLRQVQNKVTNFQDLVHFFSNKVNSQIAERYLPGKLHALILPIH